MSDAQKKPSGNLAKSTIDVDIGGRDLDIIYKPNLSPEFVTAIKQRVNPAMSSSDESSHQYEPSSVIEAFNFSDDSFDGMTEQDALIIKAIHECYDYIEL